LSSSFDYHWLGQGAVCFERFVGSSLILNFGGRLLPVEMAVGANNGAQQQLTGRKKNRRKKNFVHVFFLLKSICLRHLHLLRGKAVWADAAR
jgi:hypothetical protein